MNTQIIITILVAILVIIAIDLAIQCYRLTKIAENAEQRAVIHFKKLIKIENEVKSIDLASASYLSIYNSYRRIKKVIANAHTSTTTHK